MPSGPPAIYWSPANKASGAYTVKATFKRRYWKGIYVLGSSMLIIPPKSRILFFEPETPKPSSDLAM